MKKSLYFVSLVLASQGFVSFLPAAGAGRLRGSDPNDVNGPAPASNPVCGSMELGDVKVNFQSQDSLAAGSFVAAAASTYNFLQKNPEKVAELAQESLRQMPLSAGFLWDNSAQQPVGYKSREDLIYPNVGISEHPSLSVLLEPALSGRPLAPFAPTNVHFGATPPPPVLGAQNSSATNNYFSPLPPPPVLGAQNSSATNNYFSPLPPPPVPGAQNSSATNDYFSPLPPPPVPEILPPVPGAHNSSATNNQIDGDCEGSPGLPPPLLPEVLSLSGNQQFDHSQTSTLDTGHQNIAAESPKITGAPPPPPSPGPSNAPPPPPPSPGPDSALFAPSGGNYLQVKQSTASGGGAKSPSTAGEKESGKEGDSRGDLLQAIQKGIKLKKVTTSPTSPGQKSEPTESIAKIMQKAMATRSTAIQMSDIEDEGNETDDESWSDEDDSSTPPSSRTSVPSASKLLSRSVPFISNASSNKSAEPPVSVAKPPKTPVANTPTNFVDALRKSQANRASSSTLASAESITSIADQIDKDRKDKIRKRTQSEAGNLAPWQKERMKKQQSKKAPIVPPKPETLVQGDVGSNSAASPQGETASRLSKINLD